MISTMKDILLGLAILLPCTLAFPIHYKISAHHDWDTNELTIYLDRYYPCRDKEVHHSQKERLEIMQKFFHLPATGNMDEETERVIKQPRCGVPDVLDYKTSPTNQKWEKNDLTYRINNYTPDLSEEDVVQAIEKGLGVWSDVTPLTFKRVGENETQEADIEILFASRDHGDFNSFDGPGGVLAHAFFPEKNIGGDAHFDEDEKWSNHNTDVNLFVVAAHEFGHSLGMDHSSVHGALMAPIYEYVDPEKFQLSKDDIEGIQSLYGPKEEEPEEEPDYYGEEPQRRKGFYWGWRWWWG